MYEIFPHTSFCYFQLLLQVNNENKKKTKLAEKYFTPLFYFLANLQEFIANLFRLLTKNIFVRTTTTTSLLFIVSLKEHKKLVLKIQIRRS